FRRAVAYGMKACMRKGSTVTAIAWLCVIVVSAAAAWGCADRHAPPAATKTYDAGRPSVEPKSASAEIDELVRANLDYELVEQPITATWLGVHAGDDRIDDVRPEAQARLAARLRLLLERVRAIDDRHLDATRAFDQLLLEHRADTALFELIELRPLEKNPMVYCDLAQSAIFELIS